MLDRMVGFLPGSRDTIQRIDTMDKIPEGAVILKDEDVLCYQKTRLEKWKPQSEVWPLTQGSSILASSAAFAGCLLHFHYRTKWLIGPKGRIGYIFLALMPASFTAMLHEKLVLQDILLGRFRCPTCAELRSAVIHTTTSVAFPLIIAHLYNDIKRREMLDEIPIKRVFKYLRTPKKTRTLLLPLIFAQFAAGMFIARCQGYTYYTVLLRRDLESSDEIVDH